MKIAVVGAGSTYTPELALALAATDDSALPVDQLALHDVDPGRLSVVAGFVRRLLARRESAVTVEESTDLDAALDGASFVLTQVRVGGSAGRVLDERIPLRHGVIGQETTGAGGFSMALRTVPVVVDVAERMAGGRAAPGAHLVNFSNPAGLVAEAAARAVPDVPVVGLCNIPLTFERGFESAFGGPVEVSSFGLNHLSWISSVVVGGEERLPDVLAALPDGGDVPGPLARALGLLPNPYLRYYHRTAAMLAAQQAAPRTRAEEVVDLEQVALARFADEDLDERPPELAQRGGAWYCVAAVAYMRAVCHDTGERQVLNAANRGVIPSLPDDAFVEVPCRVGAAGAEPLPLSLPAPLPAQPLALMEAVKAYERLTIEAALTGSRRVALHALLAHPLVRDLDVAEPLLDELLAAHAEHLPRFATPAGPSPEPDAGVMVRSPPMGETMRVAVYRAPRQLDVEERPVPSSLGARDVLVRVSHCGVCGSDLHMVIEGWGRPGSIGGHEWSGRVVAVGDEVTRWSVGDLVVGGPQPTCGRCPYCLQGRTSLCTDRPPVGIGGEDGAFAEYVRTDEASLVGVPEGMDPRTAALAEPLAVALHGVNRAGTIEPGARVLVTGAGPIGLLVVAVLRARGIDEVVVSEPAPARREAAARVGASRVIEPQELVAPVMPTDVVDDPFDVAIECSGKGVAMEAALAQLRPTGTLVLVGAGMDRPRFDPNRILLQELVITGAFEYDAGGFEAALDLLASGRLPVDELVAPADVDLTGLLGAMEGLFAGEITTKVLVAPNEGGSDG